MCRCFADLALSSSLTLCSLLYTPCSSPFVVSSWLFAPRSKLYLVSLLLTPHSGKVENNVIRAFEITFGIALDILRFGHELRLVSIEGQLQGHPGASTDERRRANP